ncbi:hypothetical protein A7979_10165 [Rothia nasimurium]|uniref:Uncharacterized protein n=1 Tax=Rothia nasimurium TaxID=85336 RepID=A0A1Y1RRT4_9MICC|nr:hypothetical protein A7979_10165 [Rothia nasimurium]
MFCSLRWDSDGINPAVMEKYSQVCLPLMNALCGLVIPLLNRSRQSKVFLWISQFLTGLVYLILNLLVKCLFIGVLVMVAAHWSTVESPLGHQEMCSQMCFHK